MSECSWSGWIDLEEASKRTGAFEDYGIYQVRIVNSEKEPRQIQRLVGSDPSGLVYIGRSGLRASGNGRTVANRMREWMGIWHPGAALYDKAKTLLGNHSLEVRALFLPDEGIAASEGYELINYRRRHGELPPFNSVDPGRWD